MLRNSKVRLGVHTSGSYLNDLFFEGENRVQGGGKSVEYQGRHERHLEGIVVGTPACWPVTGPGRLPVEVHSLLSLRAAPVQLEIGNRAKKKM